MNDTTAITASDAIIEPTENTMVPMSSSNAATASAAVAKEMESSFCGEYVRIESALHLNLFLHLYFMDENCVF